MKNEDITLLEELVGYVPENNKAMLVESRANHVISSAINLIRYIQESFDEDTARDLEKRLVLAIKNQDMKRFHRGIEHIQNGRKL